MANEQNLRPAWKKGESGNPNGRPPNCVTEHCVKIIGEAAAKKLYGMNAADLIGLYKLLITAPSSVLKVIAADETSPAIAEGYAKAILADMKAGKTTTLDGITEKLYGKATQRYEITGADGQPIQLQPTPPKKLTDEEMRIALEELRDDL